MKKTYLKTLTLVFLFSLIIISCSKEEDVFNENTSSDTIYASKAPYFFTSSSDCSVNLSDLQNLINVAATENKKLIIDKDTYCINNTLYIPSNIEIDFSGATIERESGNQIVFPIIKNNDETNGNLNIVILNLVLDGNYRNGTENDESDDLSGIVDANGNGGDLFSGLELSNTIDSRLENITIKETVNAENLADRTINGINAGGLHITNNSSRILCKNINAYDNIGVGVLFTDSNNITIDESLTENNTGSGIGSSKSPYCNYLNIKTFSNGNSNLSVNGEYCTVNNVTTAFSGLTGLNIGHQGTNPSDYTIVNNVHSYENLLEGITIGGSKHILMSNIHLENNARNNLRIFKGSSKVQINNAIIHGFYQKEGETTRGGKGISIESGGGHSINNSLIYDNWLHGIGVYGVTGLVSIGSETYIYNNGRINDFQNGHTTIAGVYIGAIYDNENEEFKYSYNCSLNGTKIYSDQPMSQKTQDYGVWFQGGGNHSLIYTEIWGNTIGNIHETLNPVNIQIVN